jgi:Tol biopolymer transport system component
MANLAPDGRRVTFNSTQDTGVLNIFWKEVDGSAGDERLTSGERAQVPDSWSPDSRFLAYTETDPDRARPRRHRRSTVRGEVPEQKTAFDEGGPMFSPDGRWLAYASNESGTFEVYVRHFRDRGRSSAYRRAVERRALMGPKQAVSCSTAAAGG